MKSLWQVFVCLLILHVLATGAFVGWLYSSGRLNSERYHRAVAMFTPTIEAEKASIAEAEELAKQEKQRLENIARREAAADGPVTLNDRLVAIRNSDERAQLRLDRLERARDDIQSQIEIAQASLASEHEKIEKARSDFEDFIAERTETLKEEDFQQAVALLEQQKPKQAKSMMQALLAQGQQEQVVSYLAAMQQRKAAKVLAEFKEGAEITVATQLIEALRQRGMFSAPSAMANEPGGRDS